MFSTIPKGAKKLLQIIHDPWCLQTFRSITQAIVFTNWIDDRSARWVDTHGTVHKEQNAYLYKLAEI